MFINIIVIIFFLISIYFTFKYKFIQFKSFKISKRIMLKEKSKTAYQTFLVSLASHIGTGNIVGVTSALILGGAGSLFWMWIYAIFTSVFSLMENTLSQIYKEKICNEYRGGSCFYIFKGLNKKVISLIIAVFLVLSNSIFFQPLQVNTVSESIIIITNLPKYIIFITFSLFTILIIFKGTKKIVKFSEIIVPIMAIGYLGIGIVVILFNISDFLNVLKEIFSEAFTWKSIAGGCLYVGMKRSMFSHEAGLGTMPTISAMSEVNKKTDQGFICTMGVFIDTIVICSITGIMILIYNIDLSKGFVGCDLIVYVFEIIFGFLGKYLAVFFMICFALATVVSQYYLGESNLIFINKYYLKQKNKNWDIVIYRILFLVGIYIGVFVEISSIWRIIDIGIVLLGIVNIYAIIKLRNVFEVALINENNCKR